MIRRAHAWLAVPLAAGWARGAGCSARGARHPGPAHALDQLRAVRVIGATIRGAGATPIDGRWLRLVSGRSLHVDVGIEGHRYGIAYLTAEEVAALRPSEDLPPPMPEGDLPIVQGSGPERDVIVLVLSADDYLLDGVADGRHEGTTEAAENKLRRDVRDFLDQARVRKLP